MSVTPEIVIGILVQLVITVGAILISNARSTATTVGKVKALEATTMHDLKTLTEKIDEIKGQLGNGDSEGVFVRKDVLEEKWNKVKELDQEIILVKKYILENK